MDKIFCALSGILGSFIVACFGGWSIELSTLLIFMAIDFITGLIVAAVFKNSHKTDNGSLNSKVGYKGIVRKIFMILLVVVAYRVDLLIGANYTRDAVIIAFVVNELISIIENAGLMGIPIPGILADAIDILKK